MFLPLRTELPRVRFPVVTAAIVIACVAVYAYEQALGPWALARFARATGVVPWEIAHLRDLVDETNPPDLVPPPLTIFSSMFVHGDVVHLLGNVWFLWLFGSRLESLVGAGRFLAWFALTGIVAAALQVIADPASRMPMIGASGAIAGVLGAFAAVFPRARVRSLVLVAWFVSPARLPAMLLLGLWFLAQFVAASGGAGGVAWFAHTGGFMAGLGLARLTIAAPRGPAFAYDPARAEEARRRGAGAGSGGPRPPVPQAP